MRKKLKNKPFFIFNPKSYFYGDELLNLAKVADEEALKYPDVNIFVTVPFADIGAVSQATKNIIITAQHMDSLKPGIGIGRVLGESIQNAGAEAVFLNHAERPMLLTELVQTIKRAKELGIVTIVCASTIDEARAIATLAPDIILAEPTELIGTGKTSSTKYIKTTNTAVKEINENILMMQAAGISKAEDVYEVISLGADGTGCTSGIVKADDPEQMLRNMVEAVNKAFNEREN